MNSKAIIKYLSCLINQIYKILPMAEDKNEDTPDYIKGLLREITGSHEFIKIVDNDYTILRVISLLYYWQNRVLIEPTYLLRRDIFKAISLCKTMQNNITESDTSV